MTKALSQIQNTQRPKSILSYFFSLGLVLFSLHLSHCNEGFSSYTIAAATTTTIWQDLFFLLNCEKHERTYEKSKSNLGQCERHIYNRRKLPWRYFQSLSTSCIQLRFITSILFEKYYFLSVFKYEDNVDDDDEEDDKKIMKGKSEIVKCF